MPMDVVCPSPRFLLMFGYYKIIKVNSVVLDGKKLKYLNFGWQHLPVVRYNNKKQNSLKLSLFELNTPDLDY